jgi:hypothetical protein
MRRSQTTRSRARLSPLGVFLALVCLTLSALSPDGLRASASSGTTFFVTNVNDTGPGSLRQAIIDANSNPGPDTIAFNIAGASRTIKPVVSLPAITDTVTIDGTTQPGFAGAPVIELNGANSVSNALGIGAPGTVVRGLVINGFNLGGIGIGSAGSGSRIEGCYIGTDVTGTVAVPNGGPGISIGSSNNVIGGTTPAARNVISGNGGEGIEIEVFCCTGTTPSANGNVVEGNYIGLNAAGDAAIPNGREGVFISTSSSEGTVAGNVVGGTEPGAGNVISGNKFDGLFIGSFQTTGTVVKGNFIGTDATGSLSIPNSGDGLHVDFARNNVIGGSEPGARNVISGNGINGGGTGRGNGITLGGSGSVVRGNYVGVNAAGNAPIPNLLHGVSVSGTNQAVGGVGAGEGNTIAFNGEDGIICAGSSSTGNTFRGNSIFSNGGIFTSATIGIDLLGAFGVTPNDAGDSDNGANNLQNFPVLTSVTPVVGGVNVKGTLNSTASTTFALDFYANSVCDASGNGEGARRFGSADVTTDAGGDASFDVTFPTSLPANQVVTATATDPAGNTSEFSQCSQTAQAVGSVGFADSNVTVSEAAGTASFTVNRTGGSAGTITVNYSVVGVTATAGSDFTPTQGTLTFADGETSKNIIVPIINDDLDEPSGETAKVTLSTSGDLDTLGALSVATLTIIDDDPPPSASIGDATVTEGDSGTTAATFTVSLSAASGKTITFSFATADGTANAGSDYQSAAGTLTFNPGETSKTVSVPVIGDTAFEPDETFFVNLNNPVNVTLARAQGVGTIVNDDSSVQFAAGAAAVDESAGSVQVMVTRAGVLSGTCSVGYATSDGTASQRSDYNLALGTLRFAPGEASKVISVFITDDALVENPETFNVTLSGPVGCSLGSPSAAVVTINSDDASAGPNPIDGAQFFVRQHYRDFLNREPDTPGLQFWTSGITSCGADANCVEVKRINTSAAFFLSIEFQDTGYLVERFYKTAFGDAAGSSTFPNPHQLAVPVVRLDEFLRDTQEIGSTPAQVVVGVGDWQQQLEANKNAFALEFVTRQRFADAFPSSLTADQFVRQLNANAGGVLADADITQLDNIFGGPSVSSNDASKRAQVVRSVAENALLNANEKNRAFVLMQYFGYLRRNPNDAPDSDYTGYDFWLQKLNQFNGNFIQAEMVKAFITSTEYRQRFGTP